MTLRVHRCQTCGRCAACGSRDHSAEVCQTCDEMSDRYQERVTGRLAALRCMAAVTLGHDRTARIEAEFSRLVRENEGADVVAAREMAYDQHQDEYGCVPTQCFKYGDGPHYL